MASKKDVPGNRGGDADRARESLSERIGSPSIVEKKTDLQSVTLRYPSGERVSQNAMAASLVWRLFEHGPDGLLLEGEDAELAISIWAEGVPIWLGPRGGNGQIQAGIWHNVEVLRDV